MHAIDDLVRVIHPRTFSESAHGEGWRFEIRDGEAVRHEPARFKLFRRVDRHVFVRRWRVPKEVADWQFRWSEGTTAIRFDFDAIFTIRADDEEQACNLATALLGRSTNAGEALFELIGESLHLRLAEILAACEERGASLLDQFRRSFAVGGESRNLNEAVTSDVANELGATFRIGFRMKSSLPARVEVRCTDTFTLSDSRRERAVETTALVRLENYPLFMRSGLADEAAVHTAIRGAIGDAVRETLFGQRYYDLVRAPAEGRPSIEAQMETRIREAARAIGYTVEVFQTFADIAALTLIEGRSIDVPAGGDAYLLRNATGTVQVATSLRVRAAGTFPRLHLLVEPDASDPDAPIGAEVRRACRDVIRGFDHETFNLHFEDTVVPALRERVCANLAAYDLYAEGVVFTPIRTEEGARFRMIRNRAIKFTTQISPQADRGDADPVPVEGLIEVVGLAPRGWLPFEGKDFGFRDDSPYSEAQLREQLAARHDPPPTQDLDRRGLAILLELVDIRDRAIDVLKREMAMVPGLAREWSDAKTHRKIVAWAGKCVAAAIEDEYGLDVVLRGFGRLDTLTDETMRVRLVAQHTQWRQLDEDAFNAEIEHQRLLRGVVNEQRRKLHQKAGENELMSVGLDDDPVLRERIAQEARAMEARRQVALADSSRLQPRRGEGAGSLPWDDTADDALP